MRPRMSGSRVMVNAGGVSARRVQFGMVSRLALSAALLAGAAAGRAEAAATWNGSTSQDWFTSSNWTPATVPATGVEADINGNTAAPTIVNKAGAAAGTVSIGTAAGQSGALTVDGGSLAASGFMVVGDFGTGVMLVQNGGTVSSGIGAIANNIGSTGTMTVTGVGSSWTAGGFFDVGSSGNGTLNVLAGGKVSSSSMNVGNDTTATGHLLIDGAGSTVTVSGSSIGAVAGSKADVTISNGGKLAGGAVNVGNGGQATLTVNTGGLLSGGQLSVGAASAGTASFDGAGTTATITNTLNVGAASNGTLTASGGAVMTSTFGVIGANSGVQGAATISGAGSKWTMTSGLTVGNAGKGSLSVLAGGVVGADNLKTVSNGQILVSGAGSQLNLTKAVTFGATSGASTLVVTNGGVLTSTAATVNGAAGASATVTVSSATSVWSPTNLIIGGAGTSGVTVSNGATMVDPGDLTIDGTGTSSFTVSSGATVTQGLGPVGNNAGTGTFIAGSTGTGTLTVDSGGQLSTRFSELGDGVGSKGTATVTGAGSSWLIRAGGSAGFNGTGTLNIANGGAVTLTGQSGMVFGFNAGSTGTLNVDGAGSKFGVDASLTIGNSGTGFMTVSNGAQVSSGAIIFIGENFIFFGATPGVGTATVTGAGTKMNSKALEVGSAGGTGTLNILNGAVVTASAPSAIGDGLISNGVELNGAGTVLVDGAGTALTLGSTLDVGARGPGKLTVSGGATVSDTDGYIGSFTTAAKNVGTGVATITGAGSTWTNSGTLRAGDQGNGTLTVLAGGTVTDKTGIVGASKGGVGAARVDGAGSTWTSSGALTVGQSGSGVLTVANGGVVSAGGAGGTGVVTIASAAGSTGVLNIGADKASAAVAAGTVNATSVAFGAGTGTLEFNHTSANLTFLPVITGNGTVVQQGGTTTLAAAETYSGATNVNGGTLLVTGTLASPTVSVASGATLGGTGTLAGAVTVADGGNLKAGAGSLLTVGSLTLNNNSNLNLALGAPSNTAVVAVTGALALDGRLSVTDAGGFALGTYRLMNYGGALTNNGLVINSLPAGFNPGNWAIDTATVGAVNLIVQAGPNIQYWDGGNMAPGGVAEGRGGAGVWNLANTNWTNQAGNINAPWASGVAVFAGTGGQVSVQDAISVAGLSFKSTGYVVGAGPSGSLTVTGGPTPIDVSAALATINAAIGGTGGIAKTGVGTLILGGTNSYTGGTSVSGGALQVSADANLGDAAGGLTLDAGTLRYGGGFASARGVTLGGGGGVVDTNGFNASLTGVIGGGGRLTKTGTGTLILSGSNTYGGGAAVTGGVLQASADANLGAAAAGLSLDGGTLRYSAGFASGRAVALGAGGGTVDTAGSDAALSGVVSGGGKLTKTGAGALTLSGVNSYLGGTAVTGGALVVGADANLGDAAGGLTLDGGTLRYSAGFASARTVTLSAGGGAVDTNGSNASLSGVIGGAGALAKTGAGVLTLSGTNTYGGGTSVTGGVLLVGADANLGAAAGGLALNGGTLGYGAGFSMTRLVSLGANGGTFDTNGQNATVAGVISGAGALAKTGAGVLTLSGANTYGGGTSVTGGVLLVSADANLGAAAGGLTLDSGTLRYGAGFSSGRAVTLAAGGGTFDTSGFDASLAGVVTGGGLLTKTGAGTLTLTGTNNWAGGASVTGGTLKGTALSLRGNIFDGGAVVFDQAVDGVYAGVLSGNGAFVKQGAAVLTLTGNSGAFAGATSVNVGTLRVDGSLGGALTVAAGARLQGTGTIGSATVAGTTAPGDSIGTLTVTGNYLQLAGSTFEAEINPNGTGDRLAVGGVATLQGGTVNVITLPGVYTPGAHYTILTAGGGVSGQFASLTQSLTFVALTLNYTSNGVFLNVVRNIVPLASIAATDNQRNVGVALDGLGATSPLYDAVVFLDDAQARAAFDALSGEIHADVQGALLDDSRFVREAIGGRLEHAGEEPQGVWAEGFGAWGHNNGDSAAARVGRDIDGAYFGGDKVLGRLRFGAAVGFQSADLSLPGRASRASYSDTTVGIYAGTTAGAVSVKVGAAYAWQRVSTARSVTMTGFSDSDTARYDADTAQVWGEAAYGFKLSRADLTPFVSGAYAESRTSAFAEAGGGAALRSGDQAVHVAYVSVGSRAGLDLSTDGMVRLEGSLAWRHAGGDLRAADRLAFRAGGPGFDVTGAPRAADTATAQAGVTMKLGGFGRAYVGYSGVFGGGTGDHGVRGGVDVRF
jgi:fibronectin-binding autotransporter adhesin